MKTGDTISVRGEPCTIAHIPEHSEYVIVLNADGFPFHAFPEMIDTDPFPGMTGREIAQRSWKESKRAMERASR